MREPTLNATNASSLECGFPFSPVDGQCVSAAETYGPAYVWILIGLGASACAICHRLLLAWVHTLRAHHWKLTPELALPCFALFLVLCLFVELGNYEGLRWERRLWGSLGNYLFEPCTASVALTYYMHTRERLHSVVSLRPIHHLAFIILHLVQWAVLGTFAVLCSMSELNAYHFGFRAAFDLSLPLLFFPPTVDAMQLFWRMHTSAVGSEFSRDRWTLTALITAVLVTFGYKMYDAARSLSRDSMAFPTEPPETLTASLFAAPAIKLLWAAFICHNISDAIKPLSAEPKSRLEQGAIVARVKRLVLDHADEYTMICLFLSLMVYMCVCLAFIVTSEYDFRIVFNLAASVPTPFLPLSMHMVMMRSHSPHHRLEEEIGAMVSDVKRQLGKRKFHMPHGIDPVLSGIQLISLGVRISHKPSQDQRDLMANWFSFLMLPMNWMLPGVLPALHHHRFEIALAVFVVSPPACLATECSSQYTGSLLHCLPHTHPTHCATNSLITAQLSTWPPCSCR